MHRQRCILPLSTIKILFYKGGARGVASESQLEALKSFTLQTSKEKGRIFIIKTCIKDLDEFRKLVLQAARLKKYGTVQINISTLADKGYYEIPEGGNPWHEYAANKQTPYKFFPDPKIAPFLPAEFVKKNRQLLIDKARILRENDMEAAFFGSEPNFLPASFFDAYPNMRGPRIDHPRRSNVEVFAPCISVDETQEMYAGMMAEMLRTVPEIKTFYFKTNDAGAGICWMDWLYSGPNGPDHCKNQSAGERVAKLMESFKNGASRAGKKINIYLSAGESNFSEEEERDIANHLPQDCYFEGYHSIGSMVIRGFIGESYPVTEIINPLSLLNGTRLVDQATTVFIGTEAAYDRGYESLDALGFLIDVLERQLQNHGPDGLISTLQELKHFCDDWAGKNDADRLFNAFIALDEAVNFKKAAMPNVSALYWGVSARHMTRPLLIAPKRLTEKEESYFLPYVFNVSKEEARMDYTDIHGSHHLLQPGLVENYVSKIRQVYLLLESIGGSAPKKGFIQKMATSLRIYASIIRSCGNFAEAQAIRERNAARLNGEVHLPNKETTWTGDPDLLRFNEIMRNELDNAQELIGLLEKGGMELLWHANDQLHEDTFLPGQDLIAQLKMKRRIMLNHWRDIEDYLTSPLK
ncbi:MAG: hypothetical protein IPL46_21840 [Saprospiraceae bacterium]|nr:hypothetical protein [Saprospiraceae bacterium]